MWVSGSIDLEGVHGTIYTSDPMAPKAVTPNASPKNLPAGGSAEDDLRGSRTETVKDEGFDPGTTIVGNDEDRRSDATKAGVDGTKD